MIERTIAVPVDPDALWRTLTDPDEVGWWLGEQVDWEFEIGGSVHVLDEDGDAREGRIEEIDEGHRLRFVWWPVGDDSRMSEVTYVVEPDDDGSLLTVTERPCFVRAAVASASSGGDPWTSWDSRLVGVLGRTSQYAVWC